MAFYPQFPIYAYPMPFPNQEFYAMYPPGAMEAGPIFYEQPLNGGQGQLGNGGNNNNNNNNNVYGSKKTGYNNRKESTDSGISDFSGGSSRKTSNISTTSTIATALSDTSLEDVKEEPPYEEPDDDLCVQIVQQVEFYFSDANITKDKFLLKHVKRNKEGFVSLKLISSFKRVKHLTKDWRQVATAIERKSDKLEVNDLKTKVRRLEALPEYDETTPSRTVVATNLPMERPTIEAVSQLFSTVGEVVLIRILRPGNPIPADIKPFLNKHPEMNAKVCALVEFERTEFALRAVKELTEDEEDKMMVMELNCPAPKSNKKDAEKKKQQQQLFKQQQQQQQQQGPIRRYSHAGFGMASGGFIPADHHQPQAAVALAPAPGGNGQPRRRISLMPNMKFAPICEEAMVGQHGKEYSLNPNAPSFQMQQRRISHHRAPTHYIQVDGNGNAYATPAPGPAGPWIARRFSAVNGNGSEIAASGLALPANVIRMPRGPEGKGKGFQKWCRARMNNESTQAPAAPVKKTSHAVPIVAPPPEDKKPAPKEPEQPVEGAGALAAPKSPVPGPSSKSPAPPTEEERQAEIAQAVAEAAAEKADSDSGHEEDSCSDPEVDIIINNQASKINERTR